MHTSLKLDILLKNKKTEFKYTNANTARPFIMCKLKF